MCSGSAGPWCRPARLGPLLQRVRTPAAHPTQHSEAPLRPKLSAPLPPQPHRPHAAPQHDSHRPVQLSAQDAAFLADDTAHANANVTLLHIYDPSTAPQGAVRFKVILAHIESRLDAAPIFRRRLMPMPFGLDRPYWVDDEQFDLEYHVRHIALPKPGDWRQFCIQVSRIHARAFDLARPLWEIYVIEGLDSLLELPKGSFALLTKTHHAALDLEGGSAELTTLLHDPSPQPAVPPPPAPWFPDAPPGALPLLARGLLGHVLKPARLAAPVADRLRSLVSGRLALAGQLMLSGEEMPLVRFNSVVSPHRVFETRRFQLDEFRRIRSLVRGATLDDAVLAVCGGALRAFLDGQGELPERTVYALVPMPQHAPGEPPWTRVALMTDLDDPVERLRRIHAQTHAARLEARAGADAAAEEGTGAADLAAARPETATEPRAGATLLGRAAKLAARALAGERAPLAACSVTHVHGPTGPLYLCGARLTWFSAMLPISDGMALAFAVTSHDGRVHISPTSCRELMPDPDIFAICVRESFQELLARADARPKPPHKPLTKPLTKPLAKAPQPAAAPARPRARKAAATRTR